MNIENAYESEVYAGCFQNTKLIFLKSWGIWLKLRPIKNDLYDAIILAPRIILPSGQVLEDGLQELRQLDIISATLISDPMSSNQPQDLAKTFDFFEPFKMHHVVNFRKQQDLEGNHKRNVRYAEKRCQVEQVDFKDYLDDWWQMWQVLTIRHGIEGGYNQNYFKSLASVPGLTAHAAFAEDGGCVAISLWAQRIYGYAAHLTVCSQEGYSCKANYAVYAKALKDFQKASYLDLGSNAGIKDDPDDGLSYFKAGFANETRQSYVCGLIINPVVYELLSVGKNKSFFPAYRFMAE